MERFEAELYAYFTAEKAELGQRVKNARKLDDELRGDITLALKEFATRF